MPARRRSRISSIPSLSLAGWAYTSPWTTEIYTLSLHDALPILAGQARFGPDVEWVDSPDYHVDPARAERFASAIRDWWPALDAARLQPAYAGVRPKIVGPGEADADFRIDGPVQHGVAGLVHLYGIESPGLTSALAIGAHVAGMVISGASLQAEGSASASTPPML